MAEAAPHVGLMEDVEECHEFAAESSMERVQQDLHATSVSLGEHPSSIVRSEYWCFEVPVAKLAPSNRLEMMAPNTQVTVFGMVLVRQSPPSAKGMVFYTLEDESGYINLAFTPQVYEKFERVLARQAFICVSGKLQGEKQGNSVLVHKVHEPRLPEGEVVPLPRTEAQEMRYNRCNQPESRVKPWISVSSSARSSR
jgi:error-prone DNA polymerase